MGDLLGEDRDDLGTVPSCCSCQSELVVKQATLCWNLQSGNWEIEEIVGSPKCLACQANTELDWKTANAALPVKRIRELNDRFRMSQLGSGTVLVTNGIEALGPEDVAEIAARVRAYEAFTPECDPWGEHDFGLFEHKGNKIYWKIDCYDRSQTMGSPNPANAGVTHRVLTIMLASEY